MKTFEFWKYHGYGNDFLLIEAQEATNYGELAKKICDRHFGIGADGLLVIGYEPLEMRIFNCDGSEATMCGNGIRCFIRFCYEIKQMKQKNIEVKTKAGQMHATLKTMDPFVIRIDMGTPNFSVEKNHLASSVPIIDYPFYMHFHIYMITTLFLGTIHTIVFVNDVNDPKWIKIGHSMHQHPFFRHQTNVNFVEVVDRNTMQVRTYEKGVGMTYACGTGASASAYCAYQQGLCENIIDVVLPKGKLCVEIQEDHVLMSGEAEYIGKGTYCFKEEEMWI